MARHEKVRPPRGATDVERLAGNGRWYPDNGEPGLAFSYRFTAPIGAAAPCKCPSFSQTCPYEKAMRHTVDRWHCANGRKLSKTGKEI